MGEYSTLITAEDPGSDLGMGITGRIFYDTRSPQCVQSWDLHT